MTLLDRIHREYVHTRRTRVLSELMVSLLPRHGRVLDVGCGDGRISRTIQDKRSGLAVEGIDVMRRPNALIPVREFDGRHLPYDDNSFDAVIFVDVLHHTDDPALLMIEAARVSKGLLVLKDHRRNGFLADSTLHFMDWVGNARHGVSIPANYWPEQRWRETFTRLNLTVNSWSDEVPLYPPWASWAFGRSLHFVASLTKS